MAFVLFGRRALLDREAGRSEGPQTCGYTSLLALGKDTFLLAYSDFVRPNAKGEPCKSILVRKISVQAAK